MAMHDTTPVDPGNKKDALAFMREAITAIDAAHRKLGHGELDVCELKAETANMGRLQTLVETYAQDRLNKADWIEIGKLLSRMGSGGIEGLWRRKDLMCFAIGDHLEANHGAGDATLRALLRITRQGVDIAENDEYRQAGRNLYQQAHEKARKKLDKLCEEVIAGRREREAA